MLTISSGSSGSIVSWGLQQRCAYQTDVDPVVVSAYLSGGQGPWQKMSIGIEPKWMLRRQTLPHHCGDLCCLTLFVQAAQPSAVEGKSVSQQSCASPGAGLRG